MVAFATIATTNFEPCQSVNEMLQLALANPASDTVVGESLGVRSASWEPVASLAREMA